MNERIETIEFICKILFFISLILFFTFISLSFRQRNISRKLDELYIKQALEDKYALNKLINHKHRYHDGAAIWTNTRGLKSRHF